MRSVRRRRRRRDDHERSIALELVLDPQGIDVAITKAKDHRVFYEKRSALHCM